MDGGFGNGPACASCKHQRKRCDENCLLAPYFPATRYEDYACAHRLFSLGNIQRIISSVEPHTRQTTANTIMIEGIIWRNDPIGGCLRYALRLQAQIEYVLRELEIVNQQLTFFRERGQLHQQKMQLQSLLATPSFSLPSAALQQYSDHLVSNSSSLMPPLSQQQFGTSYPSLTLPLSSLPLKHQFGGHNQEPIMPINTPSEAFYTGDKKSLEHGYHYQSTLEEGKDVKPFDIQPIDQLIMEPYQCEQAPPSFREQGESSSKAHGKQPMVYDSDEESKDKEGEEYNYTSTSRKNEV